MQLCRVTVNYGGSDITRLFYWLISEVRNTVNFIHLSILPYAHSPIHPYPQTRFPYTHSPIHPYPQTRFPYTHSPINPYPQTRFPYTHSPINPYPQTRFPYTHSPINPYLQTRFPYTHSPIHPCIPTDQVPILGVSCRQLSRWGAAAAAEGVSVPHGRHAVGCPRLPILCNE